MKDRESSVALADRFIRDVAMQEGPLPEAARRMLRFKHLGDHCPKRAINMVEKAFIRFGTTPIGEFKRRRNGLLVFPQAPPKTKSLTHAAA